MVDATDIVLAVASFGPAIGLMYFTLRDYTYPKVEKPFFDDRKVFGMMMLGLVLGMIFFFVDIAMATSIDLMTVLLVAFAVPLLHSLIKLAILNWPKLQRKVDTAFYGLAFGMGISATYAFSRMAYAVRYPELMGWEGSIDILSMTMIVMMGAQIVLIQGSTTAMIGVGCARGQPWAYFANALMYALGYSFLLYGSSLVIEPLGEIAALAMIMAIWVICIYAYWHVYKIDLPVLIYDAKRGFKKHRRRR